MGSGVGEEFYAVWDLVPKEVDRNNDLGLSRVHLEPACHQSSIKRRLESFCLFLIRQNRRREAFPGTSESRPCKVLPAWSFENISKVCPSTLAAPRSAFTRLASYTCRLAFKATCPSHSGKSSCCSRLPGSDGPVCPALPLGTPRTCPRDDKTDPDFSDTYVHKTRLQTVYFVRLSRRPLSGSTFFIRRSLLRSLPHQLGLF